MPAGAPRVEGRGRPQPVLHRRSAARAAPSPAARAGRPRGGSRTRRRSAAGRAPATVSGDQRGGAGPDPRHQLRVGAAGARRRPPRGATSRPGGPGRGSLSSAVSRQGVGPAVADDEVRGQVRGRPPRAAGGRVGPELVEQVGERGALRGGERAGKGMRSPPDVTDQHRRDVDADNPTSVRLDGPNEPRSIAEPQPNRPEEHRAARRRDAVVRRGTPPHRPGDPRAAAACSPSPSLGSSLLRRHDRGQRLRDRRDHRPGLLPSFDEGATTAGALAARRRRDHRRGRAARSSASSAAGCSPGS